MVNINKNSMKFLEGINFSQVTLACMTD